MSKVVSHSRHCFIADHHIREEGTKNTANQKSQYVGKYSLIDSSLLLSLKQRARYKAGKWRRHFHGFLTFKIKMKFRGPLSLSFRFIFQSMTAWCYSWRRNFENLFCAILTTTEKSRTADRWLALIGSFCFGLMACKRLSCSQTVPKRSRCVQFRPFV